MTLQKARKLATEAAESAALDSDSTDAMRLLSEAVAELARSMEQKLGALERELKDLQREVRNIR